MVVNTIPALPWKIWWKWNESIQFINQNLNTVNQNRIAQNVTNALINCSVIANTTGIIVNGNNAAEMISDDFINDNFNTCVDIRFSRIEDVSVSDLEQRSTSDHYSNGKGTKPGKIKILACYYSHFLRGMT